jgi:hypothetical protein
MPDEQPRRIGHMAGDVIDGLKQQPILLALVVLNMIGIGAGVWFLKDLTKMSGDRFAEMARLTQQCFELLAKSAP